MGWSSFSDMFDGGGQGGSGSEFSTKTHDEYLADYEERHGYPDPDASRHFDEVSEILENMRIDGDYPLSQLQTDAILQRVPYGTLDLSRFCAAPSARLSHLSFEGDGTFPTQC